MMKPLVTTGPLLRFSTLGLLLGMVVLAPVTGVFADEEQPPQPEKPLPWWKEVKVDLSPEYFYWREDYNGSKLLDESGFRISPG